MEVFPVKLLNCVRKAAQQLCDLGLMWIWKLPSPGQLVLFTYLRFSKVVAVGDVNKEERS